MRLEMAIEFFVAGHGLQRPAIETGRHGYGTHQTSANFAKHMQLNRAQRFGKLWYTGVFLGPLSHHVRLFTGFAGF